MNAGGGGGELKNGVNGKGEEGGGLENGNGNGKEGGGLEKGNGKVKDGGGLVNGNGKGKEGGGLVNGNGKGKEGGGLVNGNGKDCKFSAFDIDEVCLLRSKCLEEVADSDDLACLLHRLLFFLLGLKLRGVKL